MIETLDLGREVPTQRDLRFLADLVAQCLPEDPTPSLAEMARMPDAPHGAAPAPAPQAPFLREALRLIIRGSDAAVSAVLTRLMRMDALWVEVAVDPIDPDSPLARGWGLSSRSGVDLRAAPVRPVPLIRDDAGVVVAGEATITRADDQELYGEIIVDSQTLCLGLHPVPARPRRGVFGARLVPMLTAPGLVAAPIVTAAHPPRSFLRSAPPPHAVDGTRMLQGRALQAGGPELIVTVDGVARPRPVQAATFYRHLRDLQAVR